MQPRGAALALFALLALDAAPAGAQEVNHGSAAVGGAIGGLICGSATLTYAKLRESAGGSGPLLWHQGDGPGWIGIFFLEHAALGGVTGAFGDGSTEGALIGGAVTCALDVAWIVSAEILARQAREEDEDLDRGRPPPALALVDLSPEAGIRLGLPPIVVTRRGAWMSLFAFTF